MAVSPQSTAGSVPGILKKKKDKGAPNLAAVRTDRHKAVIDGSKKHKLTFADDPVVGQGKVRETVEVPSFKQYNRVSYGGSACCVVS
mmetsp:Transcript_67037/g.153569  ORF Transcript_67037/g.153569 Transcript_67037/m.153569 type:complete len:87 (-) Transcript_67037:1236-1496(-)